jgi:hypothetical protein
LSATERREYGLRMWPDLRGRREGLASPLHRSGGPSSRRVVLHICELPDLVTGGS